jgi:MYXO-CTERM domain-containing protein
LPAGTYSFWGQQQADFTEYVLRVEVVPVPAPGGVGVAGLALVAILVPLSRRRR